MDKLEIYWPYWYFMSDIGRLGACQRVDVRVELPATDFNHSLKLIF